MGKVKQFVTTGYLVNKDKIALTCHKLHGVWLGFGGHVEERETILEALDREIKEESGITSYKLLNKPGKDSNSGPGKVSEEALPNVIQIQPIPSDNKFSEPHEHIDFIYYGVTNESKLYPETGKKQDVGWFSLSDLNKLNIWPSTKYLCIEAIKSTRRII